MTRLWTLSPSRPAKGLSLTAKLIASVGGSISRACSGAVTVGSAMVLETVALISPAMATMSPASALSTGTRSRPAEGEHLGRAAVLDDLAVHVDRLDRHVDR